MPVRGLQEQNDGCPNFEHLEAEGQRLLPEQLKTMLRALAAIQLALKENALRSSDGHRRTAQTTARPPSPTRSR